MSDKKPCVRCERAIDPHARICPYCNWDQSVPAPPRPAVETSPAADYQPPREHRLRKPVLIAVGLGILLIASFAIGSLFHGASPEETAAKTHVPLPATSTAPVRSSPRANVTLVPVTDTDTPPPGEPPITSAPATQQVQGVPSEYQRNDATAVSSAEYSQLAQRARAEKHNSTLVDPRSITGSVLDGEPARPRRPQQPASAPDAAPPAIRITTRAVPEYQPVPNIRVSQNTTARLELRVGADGRVEEVNILRPIPGETARLIAAVQSWRYKPATANGRPVPSSFAVDISFHVDE